MSQRAAYSYTENDAKTVFICQQVMKATKSENYED